MARGGSSKRHSMKVLIQEVMKLKKKQKGGPSGSLLSITTFIREKIILANARNEYKRVRRSNRLGIPLEECDPPT